MGFSVFPGYKKTMWTQNIAIRGDKEKLPLYEKYLKKRGYRFDGSRYTKQTRKEQEVLWAKEFCRKAHLVFYYDNEFGIRSRNYRTRFFREHPANRRGRYQCVYCGRYFKKDKITIDHLYPVAVVSRDLRLQKKLKKAGISSLNAPENLVQACLMCNKHKGTRMGRWIIKGKLGRHKGIWAIRKGLRAAAVLLILFLILQLLVIPHVPELRWAYVLSGTPVFPG